MRHVGRISRKSGWSKGFTMESSERETGKSLSPQKQHRWCPGGKAGLSELALIPLVCTLPPLDSTSLS